MQLKALFFDMDGVLVDVSQSYRRAIEETAAHFTGREIVAGTVQRYKNLGGFNDDWKLTHAIIHDTGIQVPFSRVVEEFQRRYRGHDWNGFIAEEPPLISEQTLQKLCGNGRIAGIVTGRPDAEAQWTLNRFGWKRYFPLVVAREKHEGRSKPDPFPLQRALTILSAAGLHLQPGEVAYIGDTVDDMEAARAAGMWAIGVVPPYLDADSHAEVLRSRGAHVIVTDLNTLPDVIESFGKQVAAEATTATAA
ncbi:MAG: HAD family hydrolase [Bacteroidetes bacterium]|nr:HAD family hydrolase [Rhodothermaceae bacterium RA]RMH65080.1 MAG: HAD family hydrolase [Bacteroidota bacterium]